MVKMLTKRTWICSQ